MMDGKPRLRGILGSVRAGRDAHVEENADSKLSTALDFWLRAAPRAIRARCSTGVRDVAIVGTNTSMEGFCRGTARWRAALLGGYLKNLRRRARARRRRVLLLDAGDMFQGTLESNLTEVRR